MPPLLLEAVRNKEAVGSATMRANRPGPSDDKQFLPVERLREQYLNRINRKINGIVGLVERVRQDPKAYPRSPKHEEGAEVATTCVRELLDASDWRTLESECIRHCAIDGIGGVEMRLVEGDRGDPDIELAQVFGDDYFYDPRSYKPDFSDARYEGIGKWVDIEEAVELFPDKEEVLRGLIQAGSDLTTRADREFKWVLSTEQQLRLCEHWYRHKGKWCWAFYVSNVLIDEGISPFTNEKGKTDRRYKMFSAAVDHDGDRYGFVRPLKGAQDETNQRRSKGLHISNSRRLIIEKGAVADVEKMRKEWARPDGVIETNPGRAGGVKADDTTQELAAQAQWYADAKGEIDGFANTNVAILTQGAMTNLSGRAINLLQQPGLAELGPFILAIRGWKLRVYRGLFCAAQTHWTSERWIRVTDDGNLEKFLQVNGLELDEHGQPVLVNALGALDVDIILDEGPDAVNMMQDTFDVLKGDPTVPPAAKIELSPIQGSVKKKILQMMTPPPPPPPDPLDVIAKKLAIANIAAEVDALTAQAHERAANVIAKRAGAVKDVFAAVQSATKGGLPGAPVAELGIESAPITPAPPDLGHPSSAQPFMPQPELPMPPQQFPMPPGMGGEPQPQGPAGP